LLIGSPGRLSGSKSLTRGELGTAGTLSCVVRLCVLLLPNQEVALHALPVFQLEK